MMTKTAADDAAVDVPSGDETAGDRDAEAVPSDLREQAQCSLEKGRLGEAEALLRQLLDREERARGRAHPDCTTTLTDLAAVLHELDRFEESVALYQRALFIQKRWLDPRSEELAMTLHNLAVVYSDMEDDGQASGLPARAHPGRDPGPEPEQPLHALIADPRCSRWVALESSC